MDRDKILKIEGDLDEDLLKNGWITCMIRACPICKGSGIKKYGSPEHPPVTEGGSSFPAIEAVYCEACNRSGYILDLDTAIACTVTTNL